MFFTTNALLLVALAANIQAQPSVSKTTTYLQNFTQPGSVQADPNGFGSAVNLTRPQKGLAYSVFSAVNIATAEAGGIGLGNGIAAHGSNASKDGFQDAAFGPNLKSQNYPEPNGPGPASISINYNGSTGVSFDFTSFWFGCAQYNATHKVASYPNQRFLDPTNCTLTVKGYRSTLKKLPGPTEKPDVTTTFNYTPTDLHYYVTYQPVPSRTNKSLVIAQMHKAVLPSAFKGLKTVTFASGKLKNVFVDDFRYSVLSK